MASNSTTSALSSTVDLSTSSIATTSLEQAITSSAVVSSPVTTSQDLSPAVLTTSSAAISTPVQSTATLIQSGEAVISTVTASPSEPASTAILTSLVIESSAGSTLAPVIVTVTTSPTSAAVVVESTSQSVTSSAASSTSSSPASLQNAGSSNSSANSGLGVGGITAIAVVVPVVVVALLVLLALFLWRKRKHRKAAEEQRRKEVEDYGFNPNKDPTIPAVASEGPDMSEDRSSGYRGWGAATGSTRKASTTLSGGHTQGKLSDGGSNAYTASSPNHSDGHSGDALIGQREASNGDELGALGAAPAAGKSDMRRGLSNASSRYSGTGPSETSDEPVPQIPQAYENNHNAGYGFAQHGPYGDGSYGGAGQGGMPVVRDVSARRNTRIQQAGNYQQGNTGIAQNF